MVQTNKGLLPLNSFPRWKKDKYGWPIETYISRPFKSFIRIVFQNIRKLL